jgi:hypothetical protein
MRTETPRTYAPATCGFLPLHLYEGPDLEHASEIVAGINSLAMSAMDFCDGDIRAIKDLSLRQMLDAVEVVERYNRKPIPLGTTHHSYMVPAERLTAAAYTLIHFQRRWDDEDTEILVSLKKLGSGGRKKVHVIAVGVCNEPEKTDETEETE